MNKIVKLFKQHIWPLSVIVIVSLIAFWNIGNIFFQQDEWLGLGNAYSRAESGGWPALLKASIDPGYPLSRYLPFIGPINYIFFNTFKTNPSLYGWLSLTLSIINAFLVYFAVTRLFKDKLIGLFTSLLWVTNPLAVQSITWIGTMFPSQFSILFFLLGFNFLGIYIENRKRKFLFLSALSITISVLFKELGIHYLIPAVILLTIVFPSKKKIKHVLPELFIISIPAALFLALPRLINSLHNFSVNVQPSLNPITQDNMIYNAFLLPSKVLSHIYLDPKHIYEFVYSAYNIHYKFAPPAVVENVIADAFSLTISFWILLTVFVVSAFLSNDKRKVIIFALLSLLATTLPSLVYPNENVILEPRYYIYSALWGSLLLVYILLNSLSSLKLKSKLLWNILAITILSCVLFYNVKSVQESIREDIVTGNYRRGMLETVNEIKPQLKQNNIFYFYTENNGFYDFQSGFGQTLAIWFHDTGKVPTGALNDLDFWELDYEGLKSYPEGKYGYFMTYEKLLNALKDNPDVKLDEIHSFYWDPQKHTVKNVSQDIRGRLEAELDRK